MLLYFDVKNYKLFKDTISLSLMANSKVRVKPEWMLAEKTSFLEKHPVLRAAAIYGANATGKSSLLDALTILKQAVVYGKNRKSGKFIGITPFMKDPDMVKKPTEFTLGILVKGIRYEYSLILDRERVYKEALFYYPHTGRRLCFRRDRSAGITMRKQYRFGKGMGPANELYGLAAAAGDETFLFASKDYPIFKEIFIWFYNTLGIIDSGEELNERFTIRYAKKHDQMGKVVEMLQKADLPIQDIKVTERKYTESDLKSFGIPDDMMKELSENLVDMKIFTIHDTPYGPVQFPLDAESDGTQKFLSLIGPIIDTEDHEGVIVIDELERSLHPILVREIIERFRNTSCSCQLIFTTHNTQLLSDHIFRKDQIWITDKDKKTGIGTLNSLNDFSDIRDSWDIGKAYLQGRFGGIPFVNFSSAVKSCDNQEIENNE